MSTFLIDQATVRTALPVLVCIALAGCSGSETTRTEPMRERTPPVRPLATLYLSEANQIVQEAVGVRRSVVLRDASLSGRAVRSPADDRVAFVVESETEARLIVLDTGEASHTVVHSAAAGTGYTMAWSPDGRQLALGFLAVGPDRGGDVLVYDRLSGAKPLGCTVSTRVVAWPTKTRLVVSDGESMHLVSAEDCTTIHSIDARKMHDVTVSPDGSKMAYIFRDLVYNRQRRAYDPDSSLFLSDIDGTNVETIVGYRYRPRNMTWSSDGSALAFDVDSQEEPRRRLISVYDLGTSQSVYLNPGSTEYSETRPLWAPGGADVAFQRAGPAGNPEACVRRTGENFVRVLGSGVLEGWVSETLVLVRAPGDSLVLVTAEAEEVARMRGPAALIAGR